MIDRPDDHSAPFCQRCSLWEAALFGAYQGKGTFAGRAVGVVPFHAERFRGNWNAEITGRQIGPHGQPLVFALAQTEVLFFSWKNS